MAVGTSTESEDWERIVVERGLLVVVVVVEKVLVVCRPVVLVVERTALGARKAGGAQQCARASNLPINSTEEMAR